MLPHSSLTLLSRIHFSLSSFLHQHQAIRLPHPAPLDISLPPSSYSSAVCFLSSSRTFFLPESSCCHWIACVCCYPFPHSCSPSPGGEGSWTKLLRSKTRDREKKKEGREKRDPSAWLILITNFLLSCSYYSASSRRSRLWRRLPSVPFVVLMGFIRQTVIHSGLTIPLSLLLFSSPRSSADWQKVCSWCWCSRRLVSLRSFIITDTRISWFSTVFPIAHCLPVTIFRREKSERLHPLMQSENGA